MSIVIERINSDVEADCGELRPGYKLLTCQGEPLLSPAAFRARMENTFGTESVTVQAEWEGISREIVLKPGQIGIEARPELSAAAQAFYAQGREAFLKKEFAEAARNWSEAAEHAKEKSAASWVCAKAGEAAEKIPDWQAAQALYLQSAALLSGGADTAALSTLYTALGRCCQYRSDLAAAAAWFEQAQQLDERAGRSLWTARNLNRMGWIAYHRGALAQAQTYFSRALALCENLCPDSLDMAESINKLGVILANWGDWDTAWDHFTRALAVCGPAPSDSLELANILNNMGGVAYNRRDLNAAQDYFIRALVIRERLAPDSADTLEMAASRNNVGIIFLDLKQFDQAREYFDRALSIRESQMPGSIYVGETLYNLGLVALEQGNLARARAYQTRVLAIYERLAPASLEYADTLEALAQIAQHQGQIAEAIAHCEAAVEILERQRSLIAATDNRVLLLAHHMRKYAFLIQCYLALDDVDAAFLTMERSRARCLLELITDRNLDFAADAPPDLLRRQAEIENQLAAHYEQLSAFSDTEEDAPQIEPLRRTLRSLERERQELEAKIREVSPRYASLQYPQPLALQAAQEALDAGTLLLSYFVGENQTFLFAITATEKHASTLPVGRAALEEKISAFVETISNQPKLRYDPKEVIAKGRELYADLIQPAQKQIQNAERLLLCPDGPLHTLPFHALVTNTRGQPGYLGLQKPLHSILSATLYAQIRSEPRPAAGRRLVAFGDPLNASWPPLPHTRREIGYLAQLYGDTAEVRLGAQVTKAAVLQESAGADILHFACHGQFDPKIPLSSALVLSPSEASGERALPEDKGLLQAWEIFQKLRLRAGLVTLSACWTGLGQDTQGEGLIGLVRAFQYAGAKSLLVSLWRAPDESSAYFMQAFYGCLQAGASKDESAQQALRTIQANPLWREPWHWAAFVLIGDRN